MEFSRSRHNGRPSLLGRLVGGLGNQLFIYAAGRALSIATNREFFIDIKSGFKADPYERRFALHHFAIAAQAYTGPLAAGGWAGRAVRMAARQYSRLRTGDKKYWFHEKSPETVLDAVARSAAHRVILEGYFQNFHYFDRCRALLKQEFQLLPDPRLVDAISLLRTARRDHVVAVHIRGKRECSATGKVVGEANPLGREYYVRAVEHALQMDPAAEFLLFTDGAAPTSYIPVERMRILNGESTGQPEIVDFAAMSECRHHIIANSTFSWWPAWLKDPARGFVISPASEKCGFAIALPNEWHTF